MQWRETSIVTPSLHHGDLLADRYRIQSVLGKGGMGIVFAAVDERTKLDVAVKLLRASAGTSTNIERFLREARVSTRVESERIVRVIECGSFNEYQPYLVMERLHGKDLGCLIKQENRLSLQAVADVVVQACEALAAAHAAGIVHRDIKPSNLFEHRPDGQPPTLKVLDFGISKCGTSREGGELTLTSSQDGGLLGSPPYMSPEQIRDARRVDPRSDLWSLGAVAYRLLAGRYPFEGTSVGAVLASILERPLAPLRDLGVDVPPEVDAILARVMERERSRRIKTAGDLAMAFAPYASARLRPLADRALEISLRKPYPLAVDEPETLTLSPRPSEHPIEPVVVATIVSTESLPQIRERRNFIAVASALLAAASLIVFSATADRVAVAASAPAADAHAVAAPAAARPADPAPVVFAPVAVAPLAASPAKPSAARVQASPAHHREGARVPPGGAHAQSAPALKKAPPPPPAPAAPPAEGAPRRDLQPNPYGR